METHSSILAWEIPWTDEPGGLYIVHGVAKSDMTEHAYTWAPQTHTCFHSRRHGFNLWPCCMVKPKKKRKSKHNLYKRVVQNTCLGCFLFYSRLQGEVKSWGQHFSPSQTLFVLDVSAALTQSCPTLCDAMNCSSSGSQFSRRESWSGLLCPSPGIFPSRDRTQVSRIVGRFFFFFTVWATSKAREYWSG